MSGHALFSRAPSMKPLTGSSGCDVMWVCWLQRPKVIVTSNSYCGLSMGCRDLGFLLSSHGIAMPKGLYFTAVVFSFFCIFSTPNLWRHWTDRNQTWTYIHLWLLFEKFGPNSLGIYPHGLGKNRFLGPTLKLTEHISETEHDINNRKETCQSTGTPYMPPKFGTLWSRNGEFLPTP